MTNPGETNRRTTPKSKHRNDQTEGFQSFFGVVGTDITCTGTAREGSIESSRGSGDGRFSIVLIIVLGLLEFSGEESNFRAARARDREQGCSGIPEKAAPGEVFATALRSIMNKKTRHYFFGLTLKRNELSFLKVENV